MIDSSLEGPGSLQGAARIRLRRMSEVPDDLRLATRLSDPGGRSPSAASPKLVLLAAAFTILLSSAVCVGAVLAPAPVAVLPFVVVICVGCPLFASWEVPLALASVRANRAESSHRRALAGMRRSLDQLPETEHPLGL